MKKELDLERILNHGETIREKSMIFDIDEEKAFIKLSRNQFEDPLDGIRELIANGIDSYKGLNKEIIIEINTLETMENGKISHVLSIRDYGSGMDDEGVKLLRTLGLSNKSRESIGRFGIGFASIFNPALNIRKVIVDTDNIGKHYQFIFNARENSMPSLDIYEINDPIGFGTEVTLITDSASIIKSIGKKISKVCKFLPYKIMIDGKSIQKEKLNADARRGININEMGLNGFIEVSNYFFTGINLLSKHFSVENRCFKDFYDPFLGKLYIPHNRGIINNDSFNLVVSRNEVIDDTELEKTKKVISSKGTELFLKSIDYYKDTKNSGQRYIILQNIVNFQNSGNVIEEYLVKQKEVKDFSIFSSEVNKEGCNSIKLLEKIIETEIFMLWESDALISLKDIRERIGKDGLVLVTDKEELAKMIDVRNSHNILMMKEYINEDDKNLLSFVYRRKPFIELNEETLASLSELNKIKFRQLPTVCKSMDYSQLNKKQKSFLNAVKWILGLEEIREIKNKYGFPEHIEAEYAQLNDPKIYACYDDQRRTISLNLGNDVIQKFIKSKNHKRGVMYFIPLLSHEIIHDKTSGHLWSFYKDNLTFDSDMRMAVAKYKIREQNLLNQ